MDGMAVTETSGLYNWIMTNGQVIYFFAQVGYWVLMVVLVAYAVAQYKRWVNFQLGTGRSGQLRADAPQADSGTADSKEPVSVEEFVE